MMYSDLSYSCFCVQSFLCKTLCTALAGGVLTTLQDTSLFHCFSDGKRILLGLMGFLSELPPLWIKKNMRFSNVCSGSMPLVWCVICTLP